jgi:hypothetical protein
MSRLMGLFGEIRHSFRVRLFGLKRLTNYTIYSLAELVRSRRTLSASCAITGAPATPGGKRPNDHTSANWSAGRVNGKRSAMIGFAVGHV